MIAPEQIPNASLPALANSNNQAKRQQNEKSVKVILEKTTKSKITKSNDGLRPTRQPLLKQ
jgi:hypothetical protein